MAKKVFFDKKRVFLHVSQYIDKDQKPSVVRKKPGEKRRARFSNSFCEAVKRMTEEVLYYYHRSMLTDGGFRSLYSEVPHEIESTRHVTPDLIPDTEKKELIEFGERHFKQKYMFPAKILIFCKMHDMELKEVYFKYHIQIPVSEFKQIMLAERPPTVEEVQHIALMLNLSTEYLLGFVRMPLIAPVDPYRHYQERDWGKLDNIKEAFFRLYRDFDEYLLTDLTADLTTLEKECNQ